MIISQLLGSHYISVRVIINRKSLSENVEFGFDHQTILLNKYIMCPPYMKDMTSLHMMLPPANKISIIHVFAFGQHDIKNCTTNAIVINFVFMCNIIHIYIQTN